MTDTADNPPRTHDNFPLFMPMSLDNYVLCNQVLVDEIQYRDIERIIRAIAYYGILGEEPRRLP